MALRWPPLGNLIIFVTIPPENKVYLSVKRQRFTVKQMTTRIKTDFKI